MLQAFQCLTFYGTTCRPQKKYPLITAGEIIAKEGNAYEAKKNDTEVCCLLIRRRVQ